MVLSAITHNLSSNEVPFPPLPAVASAIEAAVAGGNRYPDLFGDTLSTAIAADLQVPASHVVTGAGSVVVMQQLIRATTGPGEEVVYARPAFEGFPMVIGGHGAQPVGVPLADEKHDLEAMAAAITHRTGMAIICNPHNPTGTLLGKAEISGFLDAVPRRLTVVLDEAYREFARGPEVPDGVDLYREHPNLAVLRTFSKAHGLAGLRVGYAIAQDELAAALRRVSVPYGVSSPAQAGALASLRAGSQVANRCDGLVSERQRISKELRRQGWTLPLSHGNFIWLRLGERADEFTVACAAAGIAVRPFSDEGVRITIGRTEANNAFLDVASQFGH